MAEAQGVQTCLRLPRPNETPPGAVLGAALHSVRAAWWLNRHGVHGVTVRVKICGVNSEVAFDAAAEAAADWIGFVFHAASPRYVTPARAALLSGRLRGGPMRVGLFVDPSDDDLAAALDAVKLHALQLYAPPERISAVRAKFAVPVWKSIGVDSAADLPEDGGIAAALVVEPRASAGVLRPGGLGVQLNWQLLSGWQPATFWLLAGGLTPANVAAAILASGAPGVDVSSGVETTQGVKDPELIGAFVAAARRGSRRGDPVDREILR